MSRVSNALNVYLLLQSRGMMRVDELARELEVTPRMIKEYKNDLEKAGIYIGSKKGKYGGYFIENKRFLDGFKFTDEELMALKMANESVKSGKYHFSLRFELLVSKILNSSSNVDDVYYHNKALNDCDEIIEKEKNIWIEINIAINQKKKIKIKYTSLKEEGIEIKERVVNPYGVFDYKGASYFYGYCETAQDIRFFKLSRIRDYEVKEDKFDVKREFNFSEVLEKSIGIYNDESINLKLKITYPMSEIIKEKAICKNQKITQIDDHTIMFEASIKGFKEIKSWVMSLGGNAEVIEPLKLKEEIKEDIEKMREMY